ncbi:MAG: hypothetical protein ABIN18_20765 [Pseudomonadota bacterium]
MELNFTIQVWQKGNLFVAKCPELDFISQGKTSDEAKKNLFEVIQIQFEEMDELGTLEEYLAECGFEKRNDSFVPVSEMIGFERLCISLP